MFSENPLYCGCESQELWEWLRDHQKLVGGGRGGGLVASSRHHRPGEASRPEINGVNEASSGFLRCEQPLAFKGLVFLDLDPRTFCSAPQVLNLTIQDIQPFSVLINWQSDNHSGLHGYQVVFYVIEDMKEVRFY